MKDEGFIAVVLLTITACIEMPFLHILPDVILTIIPFIVILTLTPIIVKIKERI